MNTKLITFKTNHTVIAEMVEETDSEIVVKNILQVIMQPTEQGTQLSFLPFLEFSEEFKTGMTLSMNDVLVVNTPVEQLSEQYRQVFSRIQIAQQIPQV